MAINKKLIHFKTFENFNSQKLSANEENTKYTLGIDGEVLNGTPDILYQSIVWIKDAQKQWTHGQLYDGKNFSVLVEITYEELKTLRDNSQLIPGQQYRIIDYVTTTIQENTQSAGHQFDVIVTADSTNKLNEVARAILHDGDTYFADSDLNVWQIWYCLDNDTERFTWASNKEAISNVDSIFYRNPSLDTTNNGVLYYAWLFENEEIIVYTIKENPTEGDLTYDDTFAEDWEIIKVITKGKGVIYRMIDEWNNDCPYDFKNIQFIRYELNTPEMVDTEPWMTQLSTNIQAQFNNNNLPYIWAGTTNDDYKYWETEYEEVYSTPTGNEKSFYTFSTIIDGVVTDHSMLQGYCYSNIMKKYIDISDKQTLNNNIFLNTSKTSGCQFNSFGNDCTYNSFGNQCQYNSFGNGCHYNSFGNYCSNNSFGNQCQYNSFGNHGQYNSFEVNCGYNSFGNDCIYNSFGNQCQYNSFGNSCSVNSFKNSCHYNSFGNNYCRNSFGTSCASNSFGNLCDSNSFGNNCFYNSFGNDYYGNSFGNGCSYNSFRVGANKTASLKNHICCNHFDDGCSYNVIWNSDTTSSNIKVKNININRGVVGSGDSYNMINITTLNQDYEIQVAKNSSGVIKVYCEADLIA